MVAGNVHDKRAEGRKISAARPFLPLKKIANPS